MSDTLDLGALDVDEFAEFWQVYPRKKDRSRAEVAYRRARHVASAADILSAARAYAASVDGQPADRIRWAVEWLRAEPWRPAAPPAPTRRRRRADPSKPRRLRTTTRVQPLTWEQQRAKWCRERGITVAEYEARKDDTEWLESMKRRGPGAWLFRPAVQPSSGDPASSAAPASAQPRQRHAGTQSTCDEQRRNT